MDMEAIGKMTGGYNKVDIPTATTVEAVSTSEPMKKVEGPKETEKQDERQNGQNQKERAASESSIDDAVSKANRKMEHTRCEYSYHKETNRVSIKVIDDRTDKVIREIPPEKSLDMLQKMWEMAGILVDEKR